MEDEPWDAYEDGEVGEPLPGLVLIFSGDRATFAPIPLERGAIELGRREVSGVRVDDDRMSRAHARVAFDGRRWSVRDLGSRNGTAVDGEKLSDERAGEALRFVRTGSSLFLFATDLRPLRTGVASGGTMVMGPALERTFKAVTRAARTRRIVHVTGESGAGKELLARAFHEAGPARRGPFVPVNCATLQEELAERLLFGARRGAFTGAVDAKGFVQSAHGGTLFLDEVAELDLAVQAKLLRVIETSEVLPVGANAPERVDVRICSATHADLRARVAEGKMRADLFFRLGTPTVTLPPLRERLEEIPWLVERAVREGGASARGSAPEASLLAPHISLVEACLLRHWPGNVRELLSEVQQAAQIAAEEGNIVFGRHLAPRAGMAIEAPQAEKAPSAPPPAPAKPSDAAIREALRASGGKVAPAARALGMHRTQLYRWMERQERLDVVDEEG
ncbi:sigma 54-interacting transcriptional regulator [Sorangium sp. So ce131]|uniref:sigma 54-interacting transcriptional regulator n=1 Tax=Sorangium sp. So ce131 TaxID=3133282 RepID=UPI003F635643